MNQHSWIKDVIKQGELEKATVTTALGESSTNGTNNGIYKLSIKVSADRRQVVITKITLPWDKDIHTPKPDIEQKLVQMAFDKSYPKQINKPIADKIKWVTGFMKKVHGTAAYVFKALKGRIDKKTDAELYTFVTFIEGIQASVEKEAKIPQSVIDKEVKTQYPVGAPLRDLAIAQCGVLYEGWITEALNPDLVSKWTSVMNVAMLVNAGDVAVAVTRDFIKQNIDSPDVFKVINTHTKGQYSALVTAFARVFEAVKKAVQGEEKDDEKNHEHVRSLIEAMPFDPRIKTLLNIEAIHFILYLTEINPPELSTDEDHVAKSPLAATPLPTWSAMSMSILDIDQDITPEQSRQVTQLLSCFGQLQDMIRACRSLDKQAIDDTIQDVINLINPLTAREGIEHMGLDSVFNMYLDMQHVVMAIRAFHEAKQGDAKILATMNHVLTQRISDIDDAIASLPPEADRLKHHHQEHNFLTTEKELLKTELAHLNDSTFSLGAWVRYYTKFNCDALNDGRDASRYKTNYVCDDGIEREHTMHVKRVLQKKEPLQEQKTLEGQDVAIDAKMVQAAISDAPRDNEILKPSEDMRAVGHLEDRAVISVSESVLTGTLPNWLHMEVRQKEEPDFKSATIAPRFDLGNGHVYEPSTIVIGTGVHYFTYRAFINKEGEKLWFKIDSGIRPRSVV